MKIASYNTACKKLKIDPVKSLPKVTGVPKMHKAAILATFQLFIICQASWAGVKIDWNNSDQFKWRPWWDMERTNTNPSGFQFNDSNYTNTNTNSTGSSQQLQSFSERRRPYLLVKNVSHNRSHWYPPWGKMSRRSKG